MYRFQVRYELLNLSRLQYMIDTGRLDPSKSIKMDSLFYSGAVGKFEHGVKLLGDVSMVCVCFLLGDVCIHAWGISSPR